MMYQFALVHFNCFSDYANVLHADAQITGVSLPPAEYISDVYTPSDAVSTLCVQLDAYIPAMFQLQLIYQYPNDVAVYTMDILKWNSSGNRINGLFEIDLPNTPTSYQMVANCSVFDVDVEEEAGFIRNIVTSEGPCPTEGMDAVGKLYIII